MKYIIKLFLIAVLPLSIFSQNVELKLNDKLNYTPAESKLFDLKQSELNHSTNIFDTTPSPKKTVSRSTKSPGLAFIYGLFIPGMGHVYANNFGTGKYFMISEAALWLTYAAFTIYGNWLIDDAYTFSTTHAGVNNSGKAKDDVFYVNIANYNNVDEYNNEMLRFGDYDKVYLPGSGFDFYWDSEASRLKYREDKIGADRTLNDRLFVVGAVLVNHIVSAISAVFSANSYNDQVRKSSGGFKFRAGVQKNFGKIDGIKFSLAKDF